MRVTCPSCQAKYNIDDKRVPPGGAKLKCSRCKTLVPLKPADALGQTGDFGAVPLPGNAHDSFGASAVPLPGKAHNSFAAGAIPLPGRAHSASFGANAAPPGNALDSFALDSLGGGAVPLPGHSQDSFEPGAVPLPGNGLDSLGGDAVPLPGNGLDSLGGGAVPLPGNGLDSFGGGAISLPGHSQESFDPGAVPLPGNALDSFDGGAVPLPGNSQDFFDSGVLPQAGNEQAPLEPGPLPLPGHAQDFFDLGAVPPPRSGELSSGPTSHGEIPWSEPTRISHVPSAAPDLIRAAPPKHEATTIAFKVDPPPPPNTFSFDSSAPASGGSAIPLPATDAPPSAPSFDFDFPEPSGPSAASAPEVSAGDFEESGGTTSSLAFDFDFPGPDSPPAPRAAAELDFSDLPSHAGAPALNPGSSPPFDDLLPPPPRSLVPEVPDTSAASFFDDLPAPGDPYRNLPAHGDPFQNLPEAGLPHRDGPVPESSAPLDLNFGEVPLDGAHPSDDLEVDLSAPIPSSAPTPSTADAMELLSFIDDTAKEAKPEKSTRRRFHIRRRSGKVFGPFEEGVLIQMLKDGQLLGNEDVSPDGEAWNPIGTVPAFQETLQKLMEAPTSFPTEADAHAEDTAQAMERLKSVYEGRMASVTVVDRRAETEKIRRRIPMFFAAGTLVAFLLAGTSLAFTRYGLFGLKYLIPATVAPGSPQFTQLHQAREALLADTFKSYAQAREFTQAILRAKEYPEVRAVWCQSIFYLHRRYAAAKPGELSTARGELENIALLGEKHPEVVKALAGDALASNRPDAARLLLEDAVIRNDADPELKLLLSEAYVARNQPERAVQTLEKVLARNARSAKALHALGVLHQRKAGSLLDGGKREEAKQAAEKAEQLFEAALKAAPEHVISAVELGAINLLIHRKVDEGAAAVARALEEKNRVLLGPAEVARARALNGTVYAMRFRPKEAIAELEEALKLNKESVFAEAQLGRIYNSQGEFSKAVPLLKEATQREPRNLDFTEGYLTALLGAGQMQDALTVLQTANGQFPETPRIAYLDGRVNDALDNTKPAEESYLRAIRGDPALFEAHLHLARLYLRTRRLPEARQQVEEGLGKAPDNALMNAGMGELLLAEDKVGDAKAAFTRAAELDPTLADAQLGLSRVAFAENAVDAGARYVKRALELDPLLQGGHLQMGFVLWKQGKLEEAIAALEQAKANEPGNMEVTITLGAVKLANNDLAGAEAALLSVLTREPRNHKANFYRAQLKSRRAEHTQAIESMKTAIDGAPKNPAYHYEMGIILREAKKLSEAMAEWRTAIELDPNFSNAMEELGQAHLDRGELDQAIAQFERALKVQPSRARLLALIGDAYFQSSKWDRAVKRYMYALKADPKLTYVYYKVGRALSERGKSRQAVEWYRRATTAEPQNAMPWYYLGFLYKERRDQEQAVSAFRAYLARRPDAPDKNEIEDEIYDLQQGR